MTETEILRQIVQKLNQYIDIITAHVVIPRHINGLLKIREEELASLRQQLDESKELEIMTETTEVHSGWICPRCQKVHSWLSMTCDCPPNVITASTIESKEVTEIKRENNCNNCKWGKCLTKDWPCNDCKWGKCLTKDWPCNDCKWGICLTKDWPCFDCDGISRWEPIKTE